MLSLNLKYYLNEDRFEVDSNIKESQIPEIISDYLRSQAGKNDNGKEANRTTTVYRIDLSIDLSDDTFHCMHNCGAIDLKSGILAHYLMLIT